MGTQQVAFTVHGIIFPKCAVDVEHILAQVDGVDDVPVNCANERAAVVYDPARVNVSTLVAAICKNVYDTPLEQISICSDDLSYATSGRTAQTVLKQGEGSP